MVDFCYSTTDDDKLRGNGLYLIEIPSGIATCDELFDVFSKHYYDGAPCGQNWNALFDIICDFGWTKSPKILIKHSDLPLVENETELKLYLGVLQDAVRDWEEEPNGPYLDELGEYHPLSREFTVAFPEKFKAKIASITSIP